MNLTNRMFQKLIIFLFLFPSFCAARDTASQKTILFVGAHPDDETAISEVLAKYARLGHRVYVIIATDGKDGTRVTTIPAGDSLGKLRKEETKCSCLTMGLQPPIFFGIERLDTKIGVGNYFREHARFLDSLRARIPMIRPDIILAAGPDGDTHHSEHIVVSGAITELLLAEGWVEKYPLYYVAWEKGILSVDPGSYMDAQYFNVQIKYSGEDESKALEALRCYITQYTPVEMKQEADRKIKDTRNTIYFRRFVVKKGLRNEF